MAALAYAQVDAPDDALVFACARGAAATVIAVDVGAVLHGRFAEVTATSVSLDVERPLHDDVVLESPMVCCVTFNDGSGARVFAARVAFYDYVPPATVARVVLARPTRIAGCEARVSFRLPIAPEDGVDAQVSSQDGSWPARAINVSVAGLMFELTPERDPGFEPGETLGVTLQKDDLRVQVSGEVRRRVGHAYGIAFSGALPNEDALSPDLASFVKAVEESWLRRSRGEEG